MSSPRSLVRPPIALLAGLLLTLAGTTGVLAQDAFAAPSPVPEATPGPNGAIPVVPDPTVIGDGQPTPWESITVSPDGATLTVTYWSGVQGCYGLKGVETSSADGVLTVTVLTGRLQSAMGKMCIQQVFLYETTVTLDQPLILDGATGA